MPYYAQQGEADDVPARTVWELQAQHCAKTANLQKYAILFGTLQEHAEHSLSPSHSCADKLHAGHKDLSNHSGYKVQLVWFVCVRRREKERELAARAIEVDENWLRKTIITIIILNSLFVLTPNALKRFRRGCGSCLLRNTSDLGLGGFLGRITTFEWYFISSLISSSSSLLSEETDNWRCTRSWWSVLSVLRQSARERKR